jgi:hypothetical protein
MTGRSADGSNDRRGKAGRRVHFEAMVAVGGAEGGAAFDAESVDVSGEGMRLRTAYLPAIGDQLVCRFEAEDGEICAVGEVIWASEESRGGEFGLRFVDLDDETREALAALCKTHDDGEPVELSPAVAKNARVKLHIEGLASPMKARVRDADPKTASVGSSLEFLKLGRPVQVEDVDAGDRREGIVDGVKVEVDPKTSIPQLVVSLRFDGALSTAHSARAAKEDKAPDTVVAAREKPIEKTADKPAKSAPKVEIPTKAEASSAEASEIDEDDLGLPKRGEQMKNAARELSSKAKSTLDKVGQGATGFLARMRAAVAEKRAARAEEAKANAPKRVTAPPPSGALTSAGRRVVRQDKDSEAEDPIVTPVKSKKPLYIGAGVGLALLLGVGAMAAGGGSKKEAAAPKPAATAEQRSQPALPPIPGAPAVADVPLYGATPLSTTEQVLPAEAEATAPSPKASEPSDSGEAGEEADEKSELVKEFGQGSVKNAKILKVRLDGPVAGFTATENDDGFTLIVPKRKSTSTSSALVRKDKRLSAVDVVNRDDEAEITVKFKGDVPGYKAKVRGDRIEIALSSEAGGAAPKKVASKKPDAKKPDPKKAAAKKGDKKAPFKKPAPKPSED